MIELDRKKRLGQYFTSIELAKIIFEIVHTINPNIKSAIDPMMGIGNMLSPINNSEIQKFGIEIDTKLKNEIKITNTTVFFGNSFDFKTYIKINQSNFDLVITNPPFVRHLNQKEENKLEGFNIPSFDQVRKDLLSLINSINNLPIEEKNILLKITKNYSGLADLTIPSIILCTVLTAPKGILALVIPESSLTREYSISTLITLFKFFNIKAILKDESRGWFDDAQIKTVVLIAEKLDKIRDCISSHPLIPTIEIKNSSTTLPLGDLEFDTLINLIKSPESQGYNFSNSNIHTLKYYNSIQSYFSPFLTTQNIKTYTELKQLQVSLKDNSIDSRLQEIVKYSAEYIKLYDLPIEISQGLRTGANNFFYCNSIKESTNSTLISFNNNKHTICNIPNVFLKSVLRKQNELSDRIYIKKSSLNSRLLYITNFYTREDVRIHKLPSDLELTEELSNHITKCNKINIGTVDKPKYYSDLTAVKTNISFNNNNLRNWYHLPILKRRHLPEICIPRVNSKTVKAYLLENTIVVDANFLTINTDANSEWNQFVLIAILNSDWIKIQLELTGNVLGGGALKLDRMHLLNLYIPKSLIKELDTLERLGKELVNSDCIDSVLLRINLLINSVMNIPSEKLNDFIIHRLNLRMKNG